ncbi:MAG: hypothetical protein AB7D34_01325 [Sulfurimonas sp.]
MEKISKSVYGILFSIFMITSANALTVREILGLDFARLAGDGKTDLEIKFIAKTKYDRLKASGKTDEDIKKLADETYKCEREYKKRIESLLQ